MALCQITLTSSLIVAIKWKWLEVVSHYKKWSLKVEMVVCYPCMNYTCHKFGYGSCTFCCIIVIFTCCFLRCICGTYSFWHYLLHYFPRVTCISAVLLVYIVSGSKWKLVRFCNEM